MRVLVLCSGTGSIDRAFERRGLNVVSVDWLAKFAPTLCVDIMDWDYQAAYPRDHCDFFLVTQLRHRGVTITTEQLKGGTGENGKKIKKNDKS